MNDLPCEPPYKVPPYTLEVVEDPQPSVQAPELLPCAPQERTDTLTDPYELFAEDCVDGNVWAQQFMAAAPKMHHEVARWFSAALLAGCAACEPRNRPGQSAASPHEKQAS